MLHRFHHQWCGVMRVGGACWPQDSMCGSDAQFELAGFEDEESDFSECDEEEDWNIPSAICASSPHTPHCLIYWSTDCNSFANQCILGGVLFKLLLVSQENWSEILFWKYSPGYFGLSEIVVFFSTGVSEIYKNTLFVVFPCYFQAKSNRDRKIPQSRGISDEQDCDGDQNRDWPTLETVKP